MICLPNLDGAPWGGREMFGRQRNGGQQRSPGTPDSAGNQAL